MNDVVLRSVLERDIPFFFEHQSDPRARAMAGADAKDYASFVARWKRITAADSTVVARTVECGGQVAGYVAAWTSEDRRTVAYWYGSAFWNRGVATAALRLFLGEETTRPLFAFVATHNVGSLRVLEKCGFSAYGSGTAHDGVEEIHLKLDGSVFQPCV